MARTLSNDFVAKLTERLLSCGLSSEQAASYVSFCEHQHHIDTAEEDSTMLVTIPSDSCLKTLSEAQRIMNVSELSKYHPRELSDYDIFRLIQIPCESWESAKQAIALCYDRTEAEVEEVYCNEEDWLFVTEESVHTLADYLKSKFANADLEWRIFQKAALLGPQKSRERIDAVLGMLGEDIGQKVMEADINEKGWLFYRFYTDPVGCISYMLECGLSPEKVLYLIQRESYILYDYKEGRKTSYNHYQEGIDFVIQRYAK